MKILCIYSCLYDMKIFARILPTHRLSGNFCYLPRPQELSPLLQNKESLLQDKERLFSL